MSNLFLVAFARPQFFDIDVCCSRLLYFLMVNSYQSLLALFSFLTVVAIVGWLRAMFYDLLTWLSFLLTLPLAFFDNTCSVLLLSLCRICFLRRFINGTFNPHCIPSAGERHKRQGTLLLGTPLCIAILIFFHVTLRIVLEKVFCQHVLVKINRWEKNFAFRPPFLIYPWSDGALFKMFA